MAGRWIVGIVKILINNAREPEEITSQQIHRLKFILRRKVLVLHVISVVSGSVQVMHHAVGARIMQGFGTDLVMNPTVWLAESRN